jgi:peptide/nickel transport system permease protein
MKVGAIMIGLFLVLGVIGPWIAPHDPTAVDLARAFELPSAAHWLGRDENGADALSQLLWGARIALAISFWVVLFTTVVGIALGTIAGYLGGVVDDVIMRVVDVLMAFPGILLNIAVVATVAHPGFWVVVAALSLNGWVGYARVVRAQVLSLREREYVQAARAIGASPTRIMVRHLVPNVIGPVIVEISFAIGAVILTEASLSFLGIGTQLTYSWGTMLQIGTSFMWKSGFLHYAIAPGAAIAWVVFGANLLGDGLRDHLDPRARSVRV